VVVEFHAMILTVAAVQISVVDSHLGYIQISDHG
jgi:hypothetical protein